MSDKHEAGKGDKYRLFNQKKWDEGWNLIFNNKTNNKKKKTSNNKKDKKNGKKEI